MSDLPLFIASQKINKNKTSKSLERNRLLLIKEYLFMTIQFTPLSNNMSRSHCNCFVRFQFFVNQVKSILLLNPLFAVHQKVYIHSKAIFEFAPKPQMSSDTDEMEWRLASLCFALKCFPSRLDSGAGMSSSNGESAFSFQDS